ncbi:MAG: UDP-N-acetylmuramate dehydrogenase [Gammaproteobacteria bacterium]|nr:UDP-N-acetylmuramate dehydrogenase [Gammaproteobacteria bacterium]
MAKISTPETRGKLLFDVSLSRYNTWGVGGNAQCVFHPADIEDLSDFLANTSDDVPITWLGLGSNVLIRDGGIKGVVIVTQTGLKQIRFDLNSVYAEAGVACAKLARATVAKNLIGVEFMAGIPGTVGGALAMNAGAFGGQTWPQVKYVDVINRAGKIINRSCDEYEYGYRFVKNFVGEWFVGASFDLELDQQGTKVVSIKELLAHRADTQPIGKKNCGSVFKNPKQGFAASLIEQSGLKGFAIGGACVSKKHANFIINEGKATAEDIEQLMQHVQLTVKQKSNVELEPEVKFLGDEEIK